MESQPPPAVTQAAVKLTMPARRRGRKPATEKDQSQQQSRKRGRPPKNQHMYLPYIGPHTHEAVGVMNPSGASLNKAATSFSGTEAPLTSSVNVYDTEMLEAMKAHKSRTWYTRQLRFPTISGAEFVVRHWCSDSVNRSEWALPSTTDDGKDSTIEANASS